MAMNLTFSWVLVLTSVRPGATPWFLHSSPMEKDGSLHPGSQAGKERPSLSPLHLTRTNASVDVKHVVINFSHWAAGRKHHCEYK